MLLIGSSDIFFFPSKFIKQKNRGDPTSTSTFFFFFFFFKKKPTVLVRDFGYRRPRSVYLYLFTFFLIYNDKRSDLIVGMRNDVQNKPPMARYEDM